MAYYPVAAGNDTSGIYEFFRFVNTTSDGLFFTVILFVVWIIGFLAIKQYSTPRAWTAASFLCAILSILLTVVDLVAPRFMYVFLILTAIGLVWLKLEPS